MSQCRDTELLFRAVEEGDGNMVHRLLSEGGVDLQARDNAMDQTLLHVNAKKGDHSEITKQLLSVGCDVNARDDWSDTPLHESLRENNLEVARYLIQAGADLNVQNCEGMTPLHLAVYCKRDGFGIGPDERDAYTARVTELVRLMLQKGADVHVRDDELGSSVLHHAVMVAELPFVELLLQHGADVHDRDDDGDTPLHVAAMTHDRFDILASLLERGSDVNARNTDGAIPFHVIVRHGKLKEADLFVRHGADALAKDNDGQDALHYAAFSMCEPSDVTLKFVLEIDGVDVGERYDEGITALHGAGYLCHTAKIRTLVARGADVNARDDHGRTPLHCCLLNSPLRYAPEQKEAVKLLLQLGAELSHEIIDGDHMGLTFLDLALIDEKIEVANLIVAELTVLQGEVSIERQTLSMHDQLSVDQRPMLKDHLEACRSELREMRDRKVGSSFVSFLRVLTGNVNVVARYCGNSDIVEALEASEELAKSFPIYWEKLKARFDAGLERHELEERAAVALCEALRFGDSSHLVIENTVRYLSNEDIVTLIANLNIQ